MYIKNPRPHEIINFWTIVYKFGCEYCVEMQLTIIRMIMNK